LIGNLEKKFVNQALDSGWISSEGPFIREFEERFAERMNRKFGILVSNGTAALELAVQAIGIKKGDEVILPTFTIISCLNSILKVGATPIFIDAYKDTWNMNVEQIESKITKKTKAIMVVHIYGLPTEMRNIEYLANKYNLHIIEDAAEAHGQTYFNDPCGSFGLISTFSFYANKHITMGEGGIILTNEEELAQKCRLLRNLYFKSERRYLHDEISGNYRLTNIQAAIGLAQLEKLDATISHKKEIGAKYQEILSVSEKLQLPVEKGFGYENNYWVFGLVLSPQIEARQIILMLESKGIGSRPFFWPLHRQPLLKNSNFDGKLNFPVSEELAKYGLYLPSGAGTTLSQVERVAKTLLDILQ
jgi:perosamine synthetase